MDNMEELLLELHNQDNVSILYTEPIKCFYTYLAMAAIVYFVWKREMRLPNNALRGDMNDADFRTSSGMLFAKCLHYMAILTFSWWHLLSALEQYAYEQPGDADSWAWAWAWGFEEPFYLHCFGIFSVVGVNALFLDGGGLDTSVFHELMDAIIGQMCEALWRDTCTAWEYAVVLPLQTILDTVVALKRIPLPFRGQYYE